MEESWTDECCSGDDLEHKLSILRGLVIGKQGPEEQGIHRNGAAQRAEISGNASARDWLGAGKE